MTEIRFTLVVRGEERIRQFLELVERDHSHKSAVANKAIDCLIAHEARLEQLAAGQEVEHA